MRPNQLIHRLRDIFAERQIYIRSRGAVTYIAVSSRTLALLAAFMVALAVWIGFASIHVIFQDELAAERARNFHEMQIAYENELNRLQLAHDDLNAQLILTRDWFNETTSGLEKKFNTLENAIDRHAAVSDKLQQMQHIFARTQARQYGASGKTKLVGRETQNQNMNLVGRHDAPNTSNAPPKLEASAHISPDIYERLAHLEVQRQDMVGALEENIDRRILDYQNMMANVELPDIEQFMARVVPADVSLLDANGAVGGPYVPIGLNARDEPQHKQLYRISDGLDRLTQLTESIRQMPLALPIHNYRITSGFGTRTDPFRKRPAFHAGVDFGTVTGTPVYATLGGTIIRADYKGPYGLVVEIDHGNGFQTRYGHLARSRVRVGQRVEFQQHIADAGNSGRSTGPHLHYEIWYNGRVLDPSSFLETGRQVFNGAIRKSSVE